MKKYAFPFTLGFMCFIGGYFTGRDGQRAVEPTKPTARTLLTQGGAKVPQSTLKNWNQGLIAPMIPPKVVAP